jgi:hypothetical protein
MTIAAVRGFGGRDLAPLDMWRGAAALYMATTGVVYVLLLSGLEDALQTQISWVNLVVHYIMPVVVVLDWLIDPPRRRVPFARALLWFVFPVVYLVYSLARGALVGRYPYPFLDPTGARGYGGVAVAAVFIAVGLVGFTALLAWTAPRRAAPGRPREASRA